MPADFWITGVRKNQDHIVSVRLRRNFPDHLGPSRIVPREFIADLINAGKVKFCTATFEKNKDYPNGAWFPGADVHVIDGDFITTDANKKTKDNLGELATF